MLYDYLKLFHILCATLVLTSLGYSLALWIKKQIAEDCITANKIQTQTWAIIIPFATLQLVTGFTMLSLKHEDLSQRWIGGSVISFLTGLGVWLIFNHTLVSTGFSVSGRFLIRFQAAMLTICTISCLTMVFFMANKTA